MGGLISARKQKDKQKCLICEQERDKGIYLLNYFICNQCEYEIVHTETDDRGYSYYLNRLRKVRNALTEIKKDKAQ